MNKSPTFEGIKNALQNSIDVAVEIPVIPKMEKQIISLIKWADDIGVNWVNLNELEFSETNSKELIKKNFSVKNDISAAVKNSQVTANNILRQMAEKTDLNIGVHYCSSSFKDGIQLKNRIKRRAKNIARDFEIISDEGTLVKGVIYPTDVTKLHEIYELLKQEFDIPSKYISLNKGKKRIETGLWILEKIAKTLSKRGFECFMIEEYPTAHGLEVERIPLPI